MDLGRMLNTDAGAAATVSPTQPTRPPPQHARHPSTPIQIAPPHSFRDYANPPHPSPVRQPSHDGYGQPPPPHAQPPGGGQPYATSPVSYHPQQSMQAPYGAPRPAPPPMGPDARSPSIGSMPGAGSPYAGRHTSVGTPGGPGPAGYPFPPTPGHGAPNSPVQLHQYPPAGTYPQRSDSFSQPSPGPGPHAIGGQQPGHPPYMHTGPVPQTPPVGTPGGPHPALHQRSQSTHSTPTPTSAHSQHQYGAPYPGSPVMAHHQPPPAHTQSQQPHSQPQSQHEYYNSHQGSNPPTPIGPPLAPGPPRTSSNASYLPPSSPYQQRLSSAGNFAPPIPPHLQPHTSPPQQAPPIIPKPQASHSGHDVDVHRRSQSRSEREHSQSISPKTRNMSVQSSVGPTSTSTSIHDSDPRQMPASKTMTASAPGPVEQGRERAITPGKRKMDDRDLAPDEIAHQEARPAPFVDRNGSRADNARSSASPTTQRKHAKRHAEVPMWARSIRSKEAELKNANFEIRKKVVSQPPAQVNGLKREPAQRRDTTSGHASPTATRAQPAPGPPAPPTSAAPNPCLTLGPWEPTITSKRPQEEMVRMVADFIFLNVINNEHKREILSRGIEFEIEAKLGQCINKDTNDRFDLPVETECVLRESGHIAFKSSMTEEQHKAYNGFLNDAVSRTRPPIAAAGSRVEITYKHNREVDRFFELPRELEGRLPSVMRHYNHAQGRRSLKVRVTYERQRAADGSTVLVAKRQIMKARVADLSIHFPRHSMDCRISVNLEMPWDGPASEIEEIGTHDPARAPDREKDRLSYEQGPYQIDLTQVTQKIIGIANKAQTKREHELEIELNAGLVLKQGDLLMSNSPHNYSELIEGMVDNVRLLVQRNSR
ncbi:hypothetical protein RB594_005623 [Gaeumannomyces avenae]